MGKERKYIAIDLKSFFASVECVSRGLDPLNTNLVVADESRTQKTICLAVTPALKSFGVPGRPRLFEVNEKIRAENIRRKNASATGNLVGSSHFYSELMEHRDMEVSFLIAPPRMATYIQYSTKIYDIYLKYIAPEDMHVYSIDEVFIDVTAYLDTYHCDARELAMRMIRDVLKETGITATAGIGTNMYLCKIAMDIEAKKMKADRDGVRIAELDEMSYRRKLWEHKPLTDFWRIGAGYAKKLRENGLYTMGDIARCSLGERQDFHNEALLYRLFGVNAELLIDHAWGWEPTTIADIKSYEPKSVSTGASQVLQWPYSFEKTRLVVKEMVDSLVLNLVDQKLTTGQMILTIGYDIENLTDPDRKQQYHGEITTDAYGRKIPKHAHGTASMKEQTSSTKIIMEAVLELYDRIVNPLLLVRKISLVAGKLIPEQEVMEQKQYEQLNLFTDYSVKEKEDEKQKQELEKEKRIQKAVLNVQKRYGKNALVKGMNLEEGATSLDRNNQIGGHRA